MPDENDEFSFDFDVDKIEAMMNAEEEVQPAKASIFNAGMPSRSDEKFREFVLANSLDELPVFNVDSTDGSGDFVEAFLTAVKESYDATGIGTFDCIVRFNYDATDTRLGRFWASVSARVSRIRRAASHKLKKFYIAIDQKLVFPEEKCAVLRVARMSEDHYNNWLSDLRSRQEASKSRNEKLKDLL